MQCTPVPAPAQVSRSEVAVTTKGVSTALVDPKTQPLYTVKDGSLSVLFIVQTSAYTGEYQNHLSVLLFQDPCVCCIVIALTQIFLR